MYTETEYLGLCSKLLKELADKKTMSIGEVSELLGVDDATALTMMEQLRQDRLGGGMGTGNLSRNGATSAKSWFYDKAISELQKAEESRASSIERDKAAVSAAKTAKIACIVSIVGAAISLLSLIAKAML